MVLLLLPLMFTAHPVLASETREIIATTANSAVVREKDVLTDSIEYKLGIDSENKALNSIGQPESAPLLIYCDEYGINSYLPTPTYNGQGTRELIMRWNKEKPVVKTWGLHTGTGTSFAYTNARPFLAKLAQNNRLLIKWETHSQESRYLIFDLLAARESILKQQSLCENF